MLHSIFLFAQNRQDYYFEIKKGHELGVVQKTINQDQTITIDIINASLESLLNSKDMYIFEKAFKYAPINSRLDRVYVIQVSQSTAIGDLILRTEVAKLSPIEDEIVLAANPNFSNVTLPDDYEDPITGGRNTSLDLIKAPLAWTIATGENVLDSKNLLKQ